MSPNTESPGRRRVNGLVRMALLLWVAVAPRLAAQVSHADGDEWYLTTPDSVRLYIREIGSGSPVIVVHGGFGAEHSYLIPAIDGLEREARFVFYDQRGSLRSPAVPGKITIQAHLEDLDRLRRELGLARVTLIAHSMGTLLAQAYLEAYPEHVKGLILLGAILPVTGAGGSDSLMAGVNRAAVAMADRPERVAEQRRHGLDRPNLTAREETHAWRIRFAAVNLYHLERWKQMEGGGRAFFNQTSASAAGRTMPKAWDFRPKLAAHPCPIHVLNGNEDYVDWHAKGWTDAVARVPAIRTHPMPRAGHSAWIDQPELFRNALREALRTSAACVAP
ncbi:MAG: alpha/beta fold hydrolase [Gemmatimonadales bacterium]